MGIAYIVLNGELDVPWLEAELAGKNPVYCADGAYNALFGKHIQVTKVIGDLDSLHPDLTQMVETVKLPDQDATDFEKTLEHLSPFFDTFYVYGASGGSIDHFMGNLDVAVKYKHLQIGFYDPDQLYFLMGSPTNLNEVHGKVVSIIPLFELRGVTTSGLEYKLNGQDLKFGESIGIRNRAVADTVEIDYTSGTGLVCIDAKL
jgi:thiamine pyrophosphokinase